MEYSYNKCLYGNGRPTEFCIFFKIHCPYKGGNNLFFNLIILSVRARERYRGNFYGNRRLCWK